MSESYLSIFTGIIILVVLVIDAGLFSRRSGHMTVKSAALWSVFWILFALAFNAALYFFVGSKPAIEFLTGYLVEKSLSVDNLFVFLMIFSYFQVPRAHQRKVLLWGIIGAVVMRGILIWAGIHLIERYHWLLYLLGAFLIVTGIKTAMKQEESVELEQKPLLRFLRRILPISPNYIRDRFVVRESGKWLVTPLLLVLILIETTDVLFALDSIPAILGVTQDPFVLYTSNLFAILGLRALYFVLAGLMQSLRFLNYGVSLILIFVGIKMLVAPWYDLHGEVTLVVISLILASATILSLLFPSKDEPKTPGKVLDESLPQDHSVEPQA
jgi:tellurite resistance protein TerC